MEKLTPPQIRALSKFAAVRKRVTPVRIGTTEGTMNRLAETGLVDAIFGQTGYVYEINDAGLAALARAEGKDKHGEADTGEESNVDGQA